MSAKSRLAVAEETFAQQLSTRSAKAVTLFARQPLSLPFQRALGTLQARAHTHTHTHTHTRTHK